MRLKISICGLGAQDVFKKSKSLFNFTLLSGPALETFDLQVTRRAAGHGVLKLDFTTQAYLTQIKIVPSNCRYYTFQHEPGKSWKNINVPTVKETLTRDEANATPYHMDLAWDTSSINLEAELTDCVWW